MKLYICTNHDGVCSLGQSVIVAKDKTDARELLDKKLIDRGLMPYKDFPYTLIEVDLSGPGVVLFDC